MIDKLKVLEKWRNVINGAYDRGTRDCAYCQKYILEMICSIECPIQKVTGKFCCEGTPYKRWTRYSVKDFKGRRLPSKIRFIRRRKALEAAKDMYKFLETLPED